MREFETVIVGAGVTGVALGRELAHRGRRRIAIIDKGKVAGILAPDAPDVEFGLLMGGGQK